MVCNKQLSTGEELYVIDENKFVCKEDYLSSGAIKEVSLNSGERIYLSAQNRIISILILFFSLLFILACSINTK